MWPTMPATRTGQQRATRARNQVRSRKVTAFARSMQQGRGRGLCSCRSFNAKERFLIPSTQPRRRVRSQTKRKTPDRATPAGPTNPKHNLAAPVHHVIAPNGHSPENTLEGAKNGVSYSHGSHLSRSRRLRSAANAGSNRRSVSRIRPASARLPIAKWSRASV